MREYKTTTEYNVSDKGYWIDNYLKKKLDVMINRCMHARKKQDSLLVIEGGEGTGKSTIAAEIGYYISQKFGKSFSIDNFFFSAKDLVKFAQTHEQEVIIYDEPALDALNADWHKKSQKELIQFFMMGRKKRHFYIFCATKFNKFADYIIVDRSLGMVHTYEYKNINAGYFTYIPKAMLASLYQDYRSSKRRNYKKYSIFRGKFPDALDNLIDTEAYDAKKDAAIMMVGAIGMKPEKIPIVERRYVKLKYQISCIYKLSKEKPLICKGLGLNPTTIANWHCDLAPQFEESPSLLEAPE